MHDESTSQPAPIELECRPSLSGADPLLTRCQAQTKSLKYSRSHLVEAMVDLCPQSVLPLLT
jgi:hypothetical protein